MRFFHAQVYEEFQRRFLEVVGTYDGCKNAYFFKRPFTGRVLRTCFEFRVESGERLRPFEIVLQEEARIDIDSNHLEAMIRNAADTVPALRAIDIILRSIPLLRKQTVDRYFFTKLSNPQSLGNGK